MLHQGADALVEAPELVLDEATRAAFARLAEILGSNRRLRYKLDAPKWMFLSWLVQTLPYVLHGSNRSRIRCFQPRFQPDAMGRPARSAYAAADGIWPIFYAVLDRRRYGGSLRTWFTTRDDAGHLRRYYRFSIDREALARGPWCQGTVYVLPSDSFQATLGPDGQPTEEWCSAVPVRPVGRLVTEPSDFPLLQAVAGHDDADARRLVVLQLRMLLARPEPVELSEGRYRLSFLRHFGEPELVELVHLANASPAITGVEFSTGRESSGGAYLDFTGAGAAALFEELRVRLGRFGLISWVPGARALVSAVARRRLGQ